MSVCMHVDEDREQQSRDTESNDGRDYRETLHRLDWVHKGEMGVIILTNQMGH